MYKNIILALFIALIAGCSAPKPKGLPSWYTSVPQDYKYFYAVGSGEDLFKAKNSAVLSLRRSLLDALNAEFEKKEHKLGDLDAPVLAVLARSNEHLCNTLSMRNTSVVKSDIADSNTIVLIQFSKEELFKTLDAASQEKLEASKRDYKKIENETALKKYIALKALIKEYAPLASNTQLKVLSISTFRANEDFMFLKNLRDELTDLKSNIRFYVVSDANSIGFVKYVNEAILNEGLALSKKSSGENTFVLYITSTTNEAMDYSFMQSKNLVKFDLHENTKNAISFKQHTFIGKSRKNYKEAKDQAALNLNAKIHKLGIFDIIGL